MKCKDHPKYQGKHMPKVDCLYCWQVYKNEEIKRSLTYIKRTDQSIKRLEGTDVMGVDNELTGVQDINWKHN